MEHRQTNAAVNAYLFTAAFTQSQLRMSHLGRGQSADRLHTWDGCAGVIVCDANPGTAEKRFATWLTVQPENEHPIHVEIKRLVAAQVVDQLFTESGHEPIDWRRIRDQVEPTLQFTEGDDLDHGYWADVNQLIRPGKLSPSLESLQRQLPADIASGLNWSPDRQLFFVVSVLRPPKPPTGPAYEMASDVANQSDACEAIAGGIEEPELDPAESAMPELADKEVAALVQARNSAVAAWLWRKFAADTRYAANDIDIDPWCGVLVPEENQNRLAGDVGPTPADAPSCKPSSAAPL